MIPVLFYTSVVDNQLKPLAFLLVFSFSIYREHILY